MGNSLPSPVLSAEHRLLAACARGDFASVQSLWRDYPTVAVNHHLPDGDFALMLAVVRGPLALVEWLVETMGANVDERDSHGCTALMAAVQANNMDAVRLLTLDAQCDVHAQDADGLTAAHYAARTQTSSELLRLLCEVDAAPVNALDREWNTPLLTLLEANCTARLSAVQEMAALLIEAGCDPSHRNKRGMDAWEAALRHDREESEDTIGEEDAGTAGILATAVRRRQRRRKYAVCAGLLLTAKQRGDAVLDEDALRDAVEAIAEYDAHQTIPSKLVVSREALTSSSLSLSVSTPRSQSTRVDFLALGHRFLHARDRDLEAANDRSIDPEAGVELIPVDDLLHRYTRERE